MADGTDIRGSAEEAAKALESFTNAISDDIPESRTSSRSVPSAPIEGTEVAARSPTADDPALMPGSEPVFDDTNVDAENESDTDEEVLSGNEETQRVKVAQNASNQLAVAERDEEGSTDIESLSDNEGMDQDNSNSKGANRAPLMQKQRTLLAEETLMDTLSLVATETDEETLLVQEPKEPSNHTRMPQLHFPKTGIANNSSGITRRLGHRRQKSHSQPATPLGLRSREDGLRSPRSVSSDHECLHNLSSHVTAVFRSLDSALPQAPASKVIVTKSKIGNKVDKKIYFLHDAADREHLLRVLLMEENRAASTPTQTVKSVTDTLSSKVEELNVDSEEEELSGGGTDTEEVPMDLPVSVTEEWTETDPDSGDVRRVVCKTTHTSVSSAKPTENGGHWTECEGLDESGQPIMTSRVITTRTTRTIGPDGQEQVVTTTTTSMAGEEDSDERMRRSMQGVLENFMRDQGPTHGSYFEENEE